MASQAAIAPELLARARADQVATLYASWHRNDRVDGAGAAILYVLWITRRPPRWHCGSRSQNQAWRGLLCAWRCTASDCRSRALGRLLVGGLGDRRCVVGACGHRDVSRFAAASSASDRLPFQRRAGRPQSHRRLQAIVLQLRAGGARSARRPRRHRRRPVSSLYRAGAPRRACLRAVFRPAGQSTF